MNLYKDAIRNMAEKYRLQLIYAFGSRAVEAREVVADRKERLSATSSDLDIGVKSEKKLSVEEKVEIAIFFEDLFDLSRVDVVVINEAPVFLAFEIVTGELIYCEDDTFEANYQLYIMAQAADLKPYERIKIAMIMGE
jgi:predicted nucleotidyltransferase